MSPWHLVQEACTGLMHGAWCFWMDAAPTSSKCTDCLHRWQAMGGRVCVHARMHLCMRMRTP